MQKRAARTRRTILTAAAAVFDARGYQGTRLQDVVAGQPVSKGALYFHFSSKEELAAALIREQCDHLAGLAAKLRARHRQTIPLLIEMSQRIAELLRDDAMARAGVRLACERDQIGPAAPPLFEPLVNCVMSLFDEGKAAGDVVSDVDSRFLAEFIIVTLAGMQRRIRAGETNMDLRQFTTIMWRLILPGLVPAQQLSEFVRQLDGE